MRRLFLAVFCCALAGVSAAGEADAAPRATGFVPSQLGRPHFRAAVPQRRGTLRAGAPLPSFYDIRSNGWVTAVKKQGNYGSCWAFATCASVESALIKAGLAESPDLSEKNLVNLKGDSGDHGIYGGDVYSPLGYLSRWQGAVREELDPYPTSGSSVAAFGTSPEFAPCCYVSKAVILPERANVADNDFIKKALMEYGALFVNYYHDDDVGADNWAGTVCITNERYWAKANHAVTLVGWDDDFEIGSHTGAFIVKNSWGTHYGEKGYYRIAYDDVTFCTGMGAAAYAVETNAFSASVVYQYDRTCYLGYESGRYSSFTGSRIAGVGFNRYTASGDQEIVAVGLFAPIEDARYKITIYDAEADASLHSQAGSLSEMGYHVISLSKAVAVPAGTVFDVELDIDIPYVVPAKGEDYVTFPLAIEYLPHAADGIVGESYAYDCERGGWVRMQGDDENLVLKAFARPTGAAKGRLLADANATVTNGAEVVSWYSNYADASLHGNTYWALAGSLCANGYPAVDNWCLGLDPTNEASAITASLTFTNGAPCVTVSPATDRCEYVTEGRASLAEGAWSDALYDGTHRFFRVTARPKTGQ